MTLLIDFDIRIYSFNPIFFGVHSIMVFFHHKHKIFNSIIRTVMVYMMNALKFRQRTTQMLLHNKTMFKTPFPRVAHYLIPVTVYKTTFVRWAVLPRHISAKFVSAVNKMLRHNILSLTPNRAKSKGTPSIFLDINRFIANFTINKFSILPHVITIYDDK